MLLTIKSFHSLTLRTFIIFVALLGLAPVCLSKSTLPNCLTRGEAQCQVALSQLRPTQLTYGQIEVERRQAKFEAMSESEKEQFIEEHIVPIVVGPGRKLYLLDGHHFGRIVGNVMGMNAMVFGEVIHDWSSLSPNAFSKKMLEKHYFYFYDENGQGPLTESRLGTSISDLRDDPYRSLAWGVRKKDGFLETDVFRADFMWAQYFRSRIERDAIVNNFDKAVKKGVVLAKHPDASELPGYNP
jgi:hypothetical protein